MPLGSDNIMSTLQVLEATGSITCPFDSFRSNSLVSSF